MKKEFIPYEQALELNKLGFDEPCLAQWIEKDIRDGDGLKLEIWNDIDTGYEVKASIKAPLYQQAFKWFREKYALRGFIGFRPNTKQFDFHVYDMALSGMEYVKQRTMKAFNSDPLVGTYEEAELGCLIKLIEIVKNK